MRICVINGSPKGKYSITLQTNLFLQKLFPEHKFLTLNAGQRIKAYENDMKESNVDFSEKYVTQITTSKHFYDVTAHRYMEDNFHDMGMKVVHGLSADMDDLTTSQGQKDAESFFKYLMFCVNNHLMEGALGMQYRSTIYSHAIFMVLAE